MHFSCCPINNYLCLLAGVEKACKIHVTCFVLLLTFMSPKCRKVDRKPVIDRTNNELSIGVSNKHQISKKCQQQECFFSYIFIGALTAVLHLKSQQSDCTVGNKKSQSEYLPCHGIASPSGRQRSSRSDRCNPFFFASFLPMSIKWPSYPQSLNQLETMWHSLVKSS